MSLAGQASQSSSASNSQYIYVGKNQEPEYWSKQNNDLFYNIGNIGIGQAVPLSKLVVDGSASIGGAPYSETAAPTDGLIVKGNVGIGTTNPAYKVDVNGTLNATTFYQNGSPFASSQWNNAANGIKYSDGNVGIGVVNPQYALDVSGIVNFTSGLYQNGAPFVESQWTTNGSNINYGGSVAVGGNMTVNGDLTVNGTHTIVNTDVQVTEQLIISNAGTAPALVVTQTGLNNDVAQFSNDEGVVMKIMDSGRVGIGIATPTQTLDVSGNVKVSGSLNAGITTISSGLTVNGVGSVTGNLNVGGSVTQSFIGCHVRASQNITSGTLTTLVYTSIVESSGHYSTSTGKFTAPIAGYYHVTFTCLNVANAGNNTFFIYKNSGVQISTTGWALPNEYGSTTLTAITYLAVNDTVYTQARYTQGGYSSMTIFRIT